MREQKQVYESFCQEALRMPQVLCAKLMDFKQKNSTLYKMLYAALLEMADCSWLIGIQ